MRLALVAGPLGRGQLPDGGGCLSGRPDAGVKATSPPAQDLVLLRYGLFFSTPTPPEPVSIVSTRARPTCCFSAPNQNQTEW